MAFNLRDLVSRVIVKFDKTSGDKVEQETGNMFSAIGHQVEHLAGQLAALFALEKLGEFVASLVEAGAEVEHAWHKIELSVERTGQSWEKVAPKIRLAMEALSERSRFDGEDFAEMLDQLITLTGDFEQSLAAIPLVADVAVKFFDGQFQPAAETVGRVLTGQTRVLRSFGIVTKDAAEGLRILAERSREAASKDNETLIGQWAILGKNVHEAKEELGQWLVKVLDLRTEMKWLNAEMVWFVKLMESFSDPVAQKKREIAQAVMNKNLKEAAKLTKELAELQKEAAKEAAQKEGGKGGSTATGLVPHLSKEQRDALEQERDKEVDTLKKAADLGVARTEGIMRAIELEALFNKQLKDGNQSIEDRARLQARINTLKEIITGPGAPGAGEVDVLGGFLTRPKAGVVRGGLRTARGLTTAKTGADLILGPEAVERAKEKLRDLSEAAEGAAFGIAGAFQDAFAVMFEDLDAFGTAFKTLGKGIAGALLGGLSQFFSSKVKEDIAWAAEEAAKGVAALANPLLAATAPAHFAASAKFAGAAALWAVAAGAAGAGQSAVAGGGRGGISGGIPSGARDASGREINANPQKQVIIYIDGFNPKNPVHVATLGQGIKELQKSDTQVLVRPRKKA